MVHYGPQTTIVQLCAQSYFGVRAVGEVPASPRARTAACIACSPRRCGVRIVCINYNFLSVYTRTSVSCRSRVGLLGPFSGAAQSFAFLISLPRGCDGALTVAPLLWYGGGARSTAITSAVDTAVAAGHCRRLGIACTALTEEPLLVNSLKLGQVGLEPRPLDGARAQHDRPPRPRKLAVDDEFRMLQACGRGRLARATVVEPTAAASSSAPSRAACVQREGLWRLAECLEDECTSHTTCGVEVVALGEGSPTAYAHLGAADPRLPLGLHTHARTTEQLQQLPLHVARRAQDARAHAVRVAPIGARAGRNRHAAIAPIHPLHPPA